MNFSESIYCCNIDSQKFGTKRYYFIVSCWQASAQKSLLFWTTVLFCFTCFISHILIHSINISSGCLPNAITNTSCMPWFKMTCCLKTKLINQIKHGLVPIWRRLRFRQKVYTLQIQVTYFTTTTVWTFANGMTALCCSIFLSAE